MKPLPILTFALAGMAVAIHLFPGAAGCLEFSRAALERGAIWRLATGHLTHFNAEHLGWDVVAFLLLGTIAEKLSRRGSAIALGLAAAGISVAVWVWQPQFATYRGLSGLDSALFGFVSGWLLFSGLQARDRFSTTIALAAVAGFGLKCAYEIGTDSAVFVADGGFTPVPLAHLVGAATGLAVAGLSIRQRAVKQVLQLRDADRLHRAVEPELFDQGSVSKRV